MRRIPHIGSHFADICSLSYKEIMGTACAVPARTDPTLTGLLPVQADCAIRQPGLRINPITQFMNIFQLIIEILK